MVRQSRIKTFWMIFFGVMALVAVATAIFVGYTAENRVARLRMSVIDDENTYKIAQENTYRQSLYAACDSLKNLDANLGKAAISTDAGNQAQLLTNVVIHANAVNGCIANLPIAESENLENCQKFANQTQDYATYLLKSVSNGQKLTAQQRTALTSLEKVSQNLYEFLQKYAESDSGMFLTNGNGANNMGSLSDSMDQVKSNVFQYEKLIYDGPFSDSVQQKTLVSDKALAPEDVAQNLEQLFGKCTFVQSINNKGLWYCFETENGQLMTTSDGYVAQYQRYTQPSVAETTLSSQQCQTIAQQFCQKLGYDVQGVWVSRTQQETTYVNCAPVVNDAIVYPQVIKVAVNSFSGEIEGCEARAYLFNRGVEAQFGNLTQQQAKEKLNGQLAVEDVRKAIVEKDNNYFACFQLRCRKGDDNYFVYLDTNTGKEVEIFKVIDSTEGFTVM